MKAIALISGGLDSILAARVIQDQGIEILPVKFEIPFCQRKKPASKIRDAHSLTRKGLNRELEVIDVGAEFFEIILNPKHGFGSTMNPCIDCKIFMLRKAKELLPILGAQFIVTGEVLGQRPMSQHRAALEVIEAESGLNGLLLRPLSAGLLAETIPEKEGWVKRQKLLKFNSRSRKQQIALARDFGIDNYPNSSGGCLLTDLQYSKKLKDLINHKSLDIDNVRLLKIGRHFRLSAEAKLIVGRNQDENNDLEAWAKENDYLFKPDEKFAGPTCLGRGNFNEELLKLSSRILCYYADLENVNSPEVIYSKVGVNLPVRLIPETMPISEKELNSLRK